MKRLLLSMLMASYPVYQMLSWIIVFNRYEFSSQEERVSHYLEYHPLMGEDSIVLWSFITIALLIGAIILLFKSGFITSNVLSKKFLGFLLLLIYSSLGLLNIWGML